jgi:hypothetical protein
VIGARWPSGEKGGKDGEQRATQMNWVHLTTSPRTMADRTMPAQSLSTPLCAGRAAA